MQALSQLSYSPTDSARSERRGASYNIATARGRAELRTTWQGGRGIFEPFFTTKDKGQGTGLGLSTVHGVVERMRGVIGVTSETNVGSEFVIDLPAIDSAVPSGAESSEEAAARGAERILLVEDEPAVRRFISSALARFGYTIIEAEGPEDALAAAASDYDLLVTDVIMPGMDGGEVVRELRLSRPDLPVLFVSGYSHGTMGHLPLGEPRTDLLSKPFTPAGLGRAARRLLDQSGAS